MPRLEKYMNTVKYLKPVQIINQIKKPFILRSIPQIKPALTVTGKVPETMISALDLNASYLRRFTIDDIAHGQLTLLNESYFVDWCTWEAMTEASPLWRFTLHYFEFAVALAADYYHTRNATRYEVFKKLLLSWIASNPAAKGDGWHPYTISMRIPNWLICFDLFDGIFKQDEEFKLTAYRSIFAQYSVLAKRRELWQLGNHYFENLKTLVLCSLLFEDPLAYENYIELFLRELQEEILPDGVHFELSVMYHKIILEDTIRVAYWLKQKNRPELAFILPYIQKMADALFSLEKGMSKTPLFNDAGNGVSKEAPALLETVRGLFHIEPVNLDDLTASGYYKLFDGQLALMFDAGLIGPDYMPGHGHCDCLSFELSRDGKPLFVNSGTYQYQSDLRKYFRSTKAHNTVMIGDQEQSECWGEHRVARRISDIRVEKNGQGITGSYKNYLGNTHHRMLSLSEGVLTILDSTVADESYKIQSYLHIVPGYSVVKEDKYLSIGRNGDTVCKIYPLECTAQIHTSGELTHYAPEFGVLLTATCVEFGWQSDKRQHGYTVKFY